MSTIDDYVRLREQILDQIVPLLDHDDLPARDKFEVYLQIARQRNSFELYQKAFDAAQALGSEDKMGALMDLLGEVDFEVQDQAANEAEGSESSAPESSELQPEQ